MGCKGGRLKGIRPIIVGVVSLAMVLPLLMAPIFDRASGTTGTSIDVRWIEPSDGVVDLVFPTEVKIKVTYNREPVEDLAVVKIEGGRPFKHVGDGIWTFKPLVGELKEKVYEITVKVGSADPQVSAQLKVVKPVVSLQKPKMHPSKDAYIWEFAVQDVKGRVGGSGRLKLDFHPTGGILKSEPSGTFEDGIGRIELSRERSEKLVDLLKEGKCIAILIVDKKEFPVDVKIVDKLPKEPIDRIIFTGEPFNVNLNDLFAIEDKVEVGYIVLSEDFMNKNFWDLILKEMENTTFLDDLVKTITGLQNKSPLSIVREISGLILKTIGDIRDTKDINPEDFLILMSYLLELNEDIHQSSEGELADLLKTDKEIGGLVGDLIDNSEWFWSLVIESATKSGVSPYNTEGGIVKYRTGKPGLYSVIFTNRGELLDADPGFAVEVCERAEIYLPDVLKEGEKFVVEVKSADGKGIKGVKVEVPGLEKLFRTDQTGVAIIDGISTSGKMTATIPDDKHFAFEEDGIAVKTFTKDLPALEPLEKAEKVGPSGISALWVMIVALVVAVVVAALVAVIVRRRRI